jgi:hypothetical protein
MVAPHDRELARLSGKLSQFLRLRHLKFCAGKASRMAAIAHEIGITEKATDCSN